MNRAAACHAAAQGSGWSTVAKPGRCQNVACEHEIKDGWTLCRPCAIAHARGIPPYADACSHFEKHDSDPTCKECGYALELHPGTGSRLGPVVFR